MQTNEEASNSSSQWEESATGEKDTDALAAEEERRTLARKENQAIKWLRASVFVILLAATALVASFTFIYMYQDQKQDFLDDFRAAASRVIESFQTTMGRKVEGLNSMASVYTSYAIAQGSTWPNVTLPDYEIRAASARIMADVVLMNMYTIVTDEDRLGWEAFYRDAYLAKFAAFLEEETVQRDEQDERMGQRRLQYENRTIKSRNPDGSLYPAPPGDGPYVTWTQSSPISGEQVGLYMMYNALTNPGLAGPLNRTIHSKKCVFGLSNNYETKEEGNKIPRDYMKLILSLGQYRNNNEELHLDPITSIYHPIFDTFDVATRKPVGALLGTMYWKYYFKNILPPNVKGIYCVLRNTANQTLTYRIDGTEVVYIGYGDFHDPKYDDLEENIVVSSYLQNRASVETMSYSAVEIDFDFLDYKLSVYPSQATEDVYVNKSPLLFTIVVIGVFCFTSVVFVVYDTMVAKRQQIVMNRAVASGAIVSSLFPSQVRDELYKEKEPIGPEDEGGFEMDKLASKPKKIAQVYPNTTILFADLAGFTQWSSSRDPEQVFELLESIYQKFDSIAARRRVFKVETIGDCYVAVTGLPEPQENHAVIMAKFARDCVEALTEIVHSMVESLGPETADLALRVGLHSGPVTGGVLRGQKSRFQLFGDTMNTASRMESNGVKSRIHVSQETADELAAKGKGAWVTPREDKIVAKGKGELQTYWVLPSEATTANRSDTSGPALFAV